MVKREPKFKVGDQVRYIEPDRYGRVERMEIRRVKGVDPYYKCYRYDIKEFGDVVPVESILELVPGPW